MILRTLAPVDRAAPTWCEAEVLVNRHRADRYRHLRLAAPDIAAAARPGQFVMLTAARHRSGGPVLPRPMALYSWDADAGVVDILYAVVGGGTRALSAFAPGERMVVVGPLGRGFDVHPGTTRVLLLGRGIGTCSLTGVAQELARAPVDVVAVTSGRDPGSVIGAEEFRAHGAVAVAAVSDADGSSDVGELRARLCHDLDDRPPQQILTCGSERLARLSAELGARWGATVQVSVEAHMACGLGYCHGCATGTVDDGVESPLVCRDGPVFGLATRTPE
ncbi:dihydroorotate oxidase electron transfer subunit [Pseudonocardia kunmingensis]|uniref:Dihydroorotate dehydrogenase electron transfer subunit n=1 Tax=Pseudonocardia kunmingensis TaxID=630975 RepID=A0A543DR40_9PSEU|nr:dihydroorotate oxidase electron transfer subunit [Pseudonocardia kunmingensis]TQM11793.1 dihydroorotate dehydrogenase electron transfer subunit [Pseudonocardia kunmingensis]